MDKASDFESEDCGFDPHHGRLFLIHSSLEHIVTAQLRRMVSHGPLESMEYWLFTMRFKAMWPNGIPITVDYF